MCGRSRGDRPISLTILGCCLGVSGIICMIFGNQIFDSIMQKQLAISPNADYYDQWKNPSDSLRTNVYFYNWTNPEDFINHSTKPSFKECGPYSLKEDPHKVDIKWHSNNESVSYRRKSFYYFDAEHSAGSLDDKIVALNAVATTAASKTRELTTAQLKMVSMGLDLFDQRRHVIKTVDELLLSGYRDNILTFASNIPIFGNGARIPDRFGWFYGFNGSTDVMGVFNVNTGAKSASKRGQLHNWNYAQHTGFYDSYCGMVNGSAGEFFHSKLTPEGIIHIFSPELCRSVPLEYTETVQVEGITGYKYAAGLRYVDNGTIYPENSCFCGDRCYPSGILDVSNCRLKAPLFTSLPHFYQADPYYSNLVDGMEPNKSLHEFYVIVEPKTGATLELVGRLQVNVLVQPSEDLRLFKNVPRVFIPAFWMETKFRINPQKAAIMKNIPYIFWGGYVVASVILAIGLTILLWHPVQHQCSHARNHQSDTTSGQKAPDYKSRRLMPPLNDKCVIRGNGQPVAYTLIHTT